MSFGKITIRPADRLFSDYIRTRDKWTCQHCGRYCGYRGEFYKIENAHYHGRRNESTRFDPDNCVALCFTCHNKFHDNKQLHDEFMIKRLGQERFDLLELRKRQKGVKDDEMTKLYIKKLMEELDG